MSRLESESREDKQSLNEWRQVVESVAAFATSKGGIVRIGIGPKGEQFGIRIGKGTLEDLSNKIKQNTDPPQYPSMTVEGLEESAIIVIRVEESPIKPVWAFGRPLKRVGRTNQHLSREEAQRIMEVTSGRTWDALPCHGFNLGEIDNKYVIDFLKRAQLKKLSIKPLLKNLVLLSDKMLPCNGAVLLFARNPQQYFPEAQAKCARFAGTTSVKFLDEQTFEGNILSQMDKALAFVARNIRQEIRITGKPEREIYPEYPDEAVREAIINALCHRDYAAVGTIQVRIYDDRLEVWNPGTLPQDLTIEKLYNEHPSRPRNPRLAQALYRARLIEHWGTGTLRMIKVCNERGINLEFRSEAGVFIVCFQKSGKPTTVISEYKLNSRQREVLEYIRKHGQIQTHQYKKLYRVGKRQAVTDLNGLINLGLILRIGGGRATMYILPKEDKTHE